MLHSWRGRMTRWNDGGWSSDSYAYSQSSTGRLTKALLGPQSHGSTPFTQHTFGYDRPGRMTGHTFGAMTWGYNYDDSRNVLTGFSSSNSSGLSSGATAFAYDDALRLVTRTLRNGASTVYTYDSAGRLSQLVNHFKRDDGWSWQSVSLTNPTFDSDLSGWSTDAWFSYYGSAAIGYGYPQSGTLSQSLSLVSRRAVSPDGVI